MKVVLLLLLSIMLVQCKVYDTIVIGTGTSGSVLCGELSTDMHNNILCLENGYDISDGTTEHLSVNTPFAPEHAKYDGVYNGQCRNRNKYRRANAFGGGHSISGSASIRPSKEQYDNLYVPIAGDDWQWHRIERILSWMENFSSPFDGLPVDDARGQDGWLDIMRLDSNFTAQWNAVINNWLNVFDQDELNPDISLNLTGWGMFQRNLKLKEQFPYNQRVSAWTKLLKPYIGLRRNLNILSGTKVTEIMWHPRKHGQAIGVKAIVEGSYREFRLKHDGKIFVAAGPLNTPHILLRSGIGPCDYLAQYDIPCIANLTDVGTNVKDHNVVYSSYLNIFGQDTPIVVGHFKTPWAVNDLHDVEVAFSGETLAPVILVTLVNLRPETTGTIRLGGNNPTDEPRITFDLDMTETDRNRYLWMLERTEQAMAGFIPVPISELPNPGNINRLVEVYYHYGNSAPIGSVVDSTGKIHNIRNVYVTDSSIIPGQPSTHPAHEIMANTYNIICRLYPNLSSCGEIFS